MPSKDQILNNIRQNLDEALADKQTIDAAYQQLTQHALREIPGNIIDAFQKELESLEGQVTRVKNYQDCVETVLNVLDKHQSKQLLISNTDVCSKLIWPEDIQAECRKAEDLDRVSLSSAYAGIAETGSIVMLSSPQTPTTHSFLVEDHIILLPASRIVPYLESMWNELEKNNMPRTVNVLTGPSRTGDVEQTIQIGAHGPIRFHVIILVEE